MSQPDKTVVQPLRSEEGLLAPGLVLGGKYRIERELGQGGMGIVYLAIHLALRRPVAVKLLPPVLAAQPAFVSRFRREAETLARLRHRHIVSVTDYAEEEGRCYLVLDYIEGGTLEEYCKTRGGEGLPPQDAARILAEVLTGLAEAHRATIVHRDLKPANILMEKSGEAKISDFGLARVMGEDFQRALIERSSSLAQSQATSAYVGTADYMAPEVKDGRMADGRADLYAMGVIAYWLITGKRPGAMAAPASSHAKGARISPLWDKLIARALVEEPAKRFATAEEMLAAVQAASKAGPAGNRLLWPALAALGLAGAAAAFWAWPARPSAPVPVAAPARTGPSASAVPTAAQAEPARVFQLAHLPAKAEVRVAGGVHRVDAGGQAEFTLPPGEHPASIVAPGHATWRGALGATGQPTTLAIELTPLPPRSVKITSLPAAAKVTIGGITKTADADGTASFDLVPGSIAITADARRYQPYAGTLDLSDGATELKAVMEKIPPPVEITVTLPGGLQLVARRVEPGEFTAGSPPGETGRQRSDETAVHAVIEQAFYLGVDEITQAQWAALMGANPSASRALRDGNRPVEQVSWAQLTQKDTGYLARLNTVLREAELAYRADLPTEREWEYACRAGSKTAFSNGSDLSDPKAETALATIAVFRRGESAPQPVGTRPPNAWGLRDMHGNVAEWTRSARGTPVLRGGHWRAPLAYIRSAARVEMSSDARPDDTMGFRIVLRPTDE